MIPGRYSDGVRPVAFDCEVSRAADGVEIKILTPPGTLVWAFAETHIEREDGEARLYRVRHGVDTGERLVANEAVFSKAFAADLKRFARGKGGDPALGRIALWSAGAVASLAFLFFVGLPLAARLVAPLVPYSWEAAIGRSVEPQILDMLGRGKPPRLCGAPGAPGRQALDAMVTRLTAPIRLPGELRVRVVDSPDTNAFALPGGSIFILRPILDRATNPDEVAGVLAHEIGHVVNRDAMRGLIHDGSLSLLVGIVLGDVTGGTTIAMLGKMALGQAYSRDIEREADKVSVELMGQAGADPRAINIFFGRLAAAEGKSGPGVLAALSSHPITEERIRSVEKLAENQPRPRAPILDAAEWRALKAICAQG